MTLLSLTTRQSPARSRSGRSPTLRSPSSGSPGFTTKSRAASRGTAGRRAMRSAGRSKSKNWVFMPSFCQAALVPAIDAFDLAARQDVDARHAGALSTPLLRTDGLRPHRRLHDLVGVLDGLSALDLVDVFHALDHLAPNRVLVIEEAGIIEADEKLAVAGIGIAGTRHRYCPAHVRLAVEFRLKLLSGPTSPGALRAPRLGHEAVDDSMEHDTVVESVLHQLLDARDVAGRKIWPHLDHDVTFGGFQRQGIFRICHLLLSQSLRITAGHGPANCLALDRCFLDVVHAREFFHQIRIALALKPALVRTAPARRSLAIFSVKRIDDIHPGHDATERRKTHPIEIGIVRKVDEHLACAGIGPGGCEGDCAALVALRHGIVADLGGAPARHHAGIAVDAELHHEA